MNACENCHLHAAAVRWEGMKLCGKCALTLVANKPERRLSIWEKRP